jgi:signal transduction histidine kinase
VTPFAAIALYPLWSLALALGLVALRLGRRTGRGLVALAVLLALWVTGLLLLETSGESETAERVLPLGMLLAGAFIHAGADVAGVRAPAAVVVAYGYGAAVAALGALAPRLLYGPGARGAGVLFLPLAVVSTVGTVASVGWLARLAWRAERGERARRLAVAIGCAAGALGGGGVIALRVLRVGDVALAAPLLLVAVALTGYAVVRGEAGRAREVIAQGWVYAVMFFRLLPALAPGGGASTPWLVFVVFFAALPLDPLRLLVVEAIGRVLFKRPINVRELEGEVRTNEARAEHAERLAEMGRVVSAVAHEIRNPLGVIAAQAKLAEPGAKEASAAIRAQVERARRFLDDLLRYGRPRPLDVRAVEPATAVSLAVLHVKQAWKGEPPPIEVSAEGARATVDADRAALVDVLTVLVHNAAVAVEGGGGKVFVRTREEGEHVVFVVEDTGPGVPRELLDTLFQPFVTGRGRDANHPGTGLGLAIAARWVERHGGTLVHERPEGGGARFIVRWPRRSDR